jgi:hypothetical protein
MPPSFLRVRRVVLPLALQLRALEDTMTLLVALVKESLLLVTLQRLGSESSNDGAEVNSARVWRRYAHASTTTTSTTSTNSSQRSLWVPSAS